MGRGFSASDLAAISLMLIASLPRKTRCCLLMLITRRSSVISFTGARLGNIHFDAGLQHRGCDHEDDQQHQDNVHQGRDVDIGERSLSSSVRSRKGHYRGTPGASAVR